MKNTTNIEIESQSKSTTLIQDFIPPSPPQTFLGRVMLKVVNWIERLNAAKAVYGNNPSYDAKKFPWVLEIEQEWKKIRDELERVMQRRDDLPNFQDISVDVKTIQRDNQWKTFFFLGYGKSSEENLRQCPETARLLKKIPGLTTAFFSILSPRKHIPAHHGPYNGVLRYHLGLLVPKEYECCKIRINEEFLTWQEGKTLLFDDSFEHEVWNDTDDYRAVLFVDFERPIRFPFNLLNKLVLSLAVFTPYIREAEQNLKVWEKKFYT